MTLKRYNLYTFTKSKFIYTETENVKQALTNFNRRLNLDFNGYHHPNMEYSMHPVSVLTRGKPNGFEEDGTPIYRNETILSYNINDLREKIIKDYDLNK